jgi:hypothetical protein
VIIANITRPAALCHRCGQSDPAGDFCSEPCFKAWHRDRLGPAPNQLLLDVAPLIQASAAAAAGTAAANLATTIQAATGWLQRALAWLTSDHQDITP